MNCLGLYTRAYWFAGDLVGAPRSDCQVLRVMRQARRDGLRGIRGWIFQTAGRACPIQQGFQGRPWGQKLCQAVMLISRRGFGGVASGVALSTSTRMKTSDRNRSNPHDMRHNFTCPADLNPCCPRPVNYLPEHVDAGYLDKLISDRRSLLDIRRQLKFGLMSRMSEIVGLIMGSG